MVGMREVAASRGACVVPVLEAEIQPVLSGVGSCSSDAGCESLKNAPSMCDQHCMSNRKAIETMCGAELPSVDLTLAEQNMSDCIHNNLFAYPAMCNFSGRKYPLQWVKTVQTGSLKVSQLQESNSRTWFVLLDAASYVSTSSLDLGSCTADFIPISFYKLFGFPTGLGALLVKNNSGHVLKKCYYGGGSVSATISSERFHVVRSSLADRYS